MMSFAKSNPVPDFTLPATDGNTYSFADIKGDKATVIMFWCNHCPYVIPNQDRVIAMQDEYRDQGVNFAAICANNAITHPADSFDNMKRRAEEEGYNFPYLHDESQDACAQRWFAFCLASHDAAMFSATHRATDSLTFRDELP